MRCGITLWSCHAISTDIGITWCHQHCQWDHYIPCIQTIKMQSNMIFWSCDTIAIANAIRCCHWNWCHLMPLASVSVSHDAYSIINGTIILLGQDDRSEVQNVSWSYDATGTDISIIWCKQLLRSRFHIPGTCLWTNMPTTLHIYTPLHFYCSLHKDLSLDTSIKNQYTATYINQTTAKYKPWTNMLLKCYIYATGPNYLTASMGEVC